MSLKNRARAVAQILTIEARKRILCGMFRQDSKTPTGVARILLAKRARARANRERAPQVFFSWPEAPLSVPECSSESSNRAPPAPSPPVKRGPLQELDQPKLQNARRRDIGLGPEHDWSSHAADAFGLMAVCADDPGAMRAFYRRIEYPRLGIV
jgi:hypothetical protein